MSNDPIAHASAFHNAVMTFAQMYGAHLDRLVAQNVQLRQQAAMALAQTQRQAVPPAVWEVGSGSEALHSVIRASDGSVLCNVYATPHATAQEGARRIVEALNAMEARGA